MNRVVDAPVVIVVIGDYDGYKRGDEMWDVIVEVGTMQVDFQNMMSERLKQTYRTRSGAKLQGVVMFDCEKVAEYFKVKVNQFPVLLLALGRAKVEAPKGEVRFLIERTIPWK